MRRNPGDATAHRLRRVFLALALCFLAAAMRPASVPAGEATTPTLDRKLTLNIWGGNLNDAARAIMEQTGVDVLFFLPDFPPEKNNNSIFLVTGEVSLRTVMETLARRQGFRYRLADSGRLEVSRGYGWVPQDDYAVRFLRLDPLVDRDNPDLDRLKDFLSEFIKPLGVLGGDFSLALAQSPTPDNRSSTRAEAVLPPVLADYFDKAVKCLSGDSGDYAGLSGVGRPRQTSLKIAHQSRLEWETFLTRDFQVPRDADLRACLASICRQAGIAMALENPPPAGLRPPAVAADKASLGRVTGDLAVRLGMTRRVFLDSGAVVFEEAQKEEWENDHRSREFFWTGLAVGGFDARRAADRAGGGAALAATLHKDVFPGIWRDPVTAMGYSEITGRLAVIAPMNVLEAVGAKLEAMARE